MTPQELINQIATVPFDPSPSIAAYQKFITDFPEDKLTSLTDQQYNGNQNHDSFCHNLVYTPNLSFGMRSINKESLGNKANPVTTKLADAINFYLLNQAIVIIKSEIVSDDFHARFSAKMRHYKYLIYNRRVRSVIYTNRAWHVPQHLDISAMHEASQYFLGTHNLNAFRSLHCNAQNPVRTISNIKVYRDSDFVIMEISARSFLHNQVRITIGTLKQIGEHKYLPEHIKDLLEKQDRRVAGVTAPPYGLYLTGVDY